MFGTETTTLLAKGKMLNPLRGKMFKRRSRASFECLVIIPGAPLASLSSGVNDGVERLSRESDLAGIRLGGTVLVIRLPATWLLMGPNGFSGGEGENDELGDWEMMDARLPVTQSDDPPSGGHFAVGMSKTPPGTARERSRVIVHVVGALDLANGKYARSVVASESPIPNGETAVGGAKTKLLVCIIGDRRLRHVLPT
jgi:hypothetical protein